MTKFIFCLLPLGFLSASPAATQAGTQFTIVAKTGDPAPDGNGVFFAFEAPAVHNSGLAASEGFLTPNTPNTGRGIFLGNGVDPLLQLARRLDPTPDGNRRFPGTRPDGNGTFFGLGFNFSEIAVNDRGQIAFYARLINTDNGAADDAGIFFFDDSLGLVNVIREGDAFLDSTILRLNFGEQIREDEYSGFNDLGEVAFAYTLVNGDSGIAIWTVPEPATGVLLLPGLMLFTRRARHRHRMQHPTNRRTFCQMAQAKGVGPWELDR